MRRAIAFEAMARHHVVSHRHPVSDRGKKVSLLTERSTAFAGRIAASLEADYGHKSLMNQ
jgi:hypothetical protein